MNRRSQSALEYLTTYAWVIAIIVIGLAIVFGLGIFNSRGSLPNTVLSGFSGVTVTAAVTNYTVLEMIVANTLSHKINIASVYVLVNSVNLTVYTCQNSTLYTGEQTLCTVPGSFSGSNNKVSIVYTFYNGAFNQQSISTGSVLTNPVTGKIIYNPNI